MGLENLCLDQVVFRFSNIRFDILDKVSSTYRLVSIGSRVGNRGWYNRRYEAR